MHDKSNVKIRLESKCGLENFVHDGQGKLYWKGEVLYVRYEESQHDLAKTMTTLRIAEDSVKIIRHGAIQAEQTFLPLVKTTGFLHSSGVRFALQMYTHAILQTKHPHYWLIEWSYDITLNEQEIGRYEVKLSIWEEE